MHPESNQIPSKLNKRKHPNNETEESSDSSEFDTLLEEIVTRKRFSSIHHSNLPIEDPKDDINAFKSILGGTSTSAPFISTNLSKDVFKVERSNAFGKRVAHELIVDIEFDRELHDVYGNQIIWKRPKEMDPAAQFYVEIPTHSAPEIFEGPLGNCVMAAASQTIMLYTTLFHYVVPKQQDFKTNYNGLFFFRFWKLGTWETVWIDDLLPFEKEGPNEPLFSVLQYHHSYWYSLLEKAYAKFYGSYNKMRTVTLEEALQDFTGGIVESYKLTNELVLKLEHFMSKSNVYHSYICLAAKEEFMSKILGEHLDRNKIYRVMKVKNRKYEKLIVVCKIFRVLENSHAPKKHKIKHNQESDRRLGHGVVTLKLNEVMVKFNHMFIVNIGVNKTDKPDKSNHWKVFTRTGNWDSNNCGGCPSSESFWKNPQFRFKIVSGEGDKNSTLIIGLFTNAHTANDSSNTGVCLFKIGNQSDKDLATEPLTSNNSNMIGCHKFESKRQKREFVKRYNIPPGTYAVIPYTGSTEHEGDFQLRFFAEKPLKIWEISTLAEDDVVLDERSIYLSTISSVGAKLVAVSVLCLILYKLMMEIINQHE